MLRMEKEITFILHFSEESVFCESLNLVPCISISNAFLYEQWRGDLGKAIRFGCLKKAKKVKNWDFHTLASQL